MVKTSSALAVGLGSAFGFGLAVLFVVIWWYSMDAFWSSELWNIFEVTYILTGVLTWLAGVAVWYMGHEIIGETLVVWGVALIVFVVFVYWLFGF
jgi:hypothetical protein